MKILTEMCTGNFLMQDEKLSKEMKLSGLTFCRIFVYFLRIRFQLMDRLVEIKFFHNNVSFIRKLCNILIFIDVLLFSSVFFMNLPKV